MTMRVIHALNATQIDQLCALYQQQWWSRQRTREGVTAMLAASSAVVALIDTDARLIGFSRALSDGIYRAAIYDVMVLEAQQKTGLGSQLMNAILAHPKLANVARIELACLPELVPFYERWGLKTVPPAWRQMVRGTSE